MADVKDWLRPVAGKHSIKEAVISLFLSSRIIKPERFETLIQEAFKDKFQQFEAIGNIQFQIAGDAEGKLKTPIPQPQLNQNMGFRFTQFSEGKTTSVLQGINEPGRSFMSFHSLAYNRWEPFYNDFIATVSALANFQDAIFVDAFSLHYVDEFEVMSEVFETKEVFNEHSSLLPKDYFYHLPLHYQITTVRKEAFEFFDRLEIKIEGRPDVFVTISNNIIRNLPEPVALNDLIGSPDMEQMLGIAHGQNKETLKNLLAKPVCNLISLS